MISITVIDQIIDRAKKNKDGGWLAYEAAKREYGRLYGYDGKQYDDFIRRLTDAMGI